MSNRTNDTKWFQLQPIDAWFFRDSRPSNAGEDQSDLQSLFPPHNQTIIGAIRAALARQMGWQNSDWSQEIKQVLGDGFKDLGPLKFTGPFIAMRDKECEDQIELLYSMPLHVLGIIEHLDGGKCVPAFIPENWVRPSESPILSDRGRVHLPVFPQEQVHRSLKQGMEFYVTTAGMNCILNGELPQSNQCIHRSKLYAHEIRIGIQRRQSAAVMQDVDLTDAKSSMYSPQFVRLKEGVSLVIGINGFPENIVLPKVFPMGGESRMASCDVLPNAPVFPTTQPGNLLVLASPASFNAVDHSQANQWIGAGPNESAARLSTQLKCAVKTCLIDRPLRIGGFDNGTRLPLVPFVASGSVWWLQDADSLNVNLWTSNHLGVSNEHGYGMVFSGKASN